MSDLDHFHHPALSLVAKIRTNLAGSSSLHILWNMDLLMISTTNQPSGGSGKN